MKSFFLSFPSERRVESAIFLVPPLLLRASAKAARLTMMTKATANLARYRPPPFNAPERPHAASKIGDASFPFSPFPLPFRRQKVMLMKKKWGQEGATPAEKSSPLPLPPPAHGCGICTAFHLSLLGFFFPLANIVMDKWRKRTGKVRCESTFPSFFIHLLDAHLNGTDTDERKW